MEPYNPKIRYLGPQGHWLNKYIPEYPPNAPIELKELWNHAAYGHDCDFEGDEFTGFMGWFKKWINRVEVRKEIHQANVVFYNKLVIAIEKTKHLMTIETRIAAHSYANIVYEAVESFGWAFYKTGNKK